MRRFLLSFVTGTSKTRWSDPSPAHRGQSHAEDFDEEHDAIVAGCRALDAGAHEVTITDAQTERKLLQSEIQRRCKEIKL